MAARVYTLMQLTYGDIIAAGLDIMNYGIQKHGWASKHATGEFSVELDGDHADIKFTLTDVLAQIPVHANLVGCVISITGKAQSNAQVSVVYEIDTAGLQYKFVGFLSDCALKSVKTPYKKLPIAVVTAQWGSSADLYMPTEDSWNGCSLYNALGDTMPGMPFKGMDALVFQ